jgi:hypothetical protein
MGAYHEKGALLVDVRAVTVDSLLDELLPAQKYDDTQLLWLQVCTIEVVEFAFR